jgi:hypothetical protein
LGSRRSKIPKLPKINSLNALELDVSQLFGLFEEISLKRPLCLYDYDEGIIESAVEALESKDAVFYSFLDAKKMRKVCGDHNIEFGHIIKLLPGLGTV